MADNKDMTTQEAGRKGGEATARSHGKEFYQEIGKKGGETVKQKYGPEFYSEIGEKGGETVSQDRKHMAKIGRKGGEHSHGGGRNQNGE